MSITWFDGFDLYNSTNNGSSKYQGFPTGNVYATGRLGVGQCLDVSNGGIKFPVNNGATAAAISFGFALKLSTINNQLFRLWNGGTPIASLKINGSGAIEAYRGDNSTLLGTSAGGIIATNQWNYMEIEYERSTTVGIFKVYVNGVQVLNLTAQNTGSADIDSVQFYWPQEYWLDDLYCTNTSTKLGECRVDVLRPSADTATKDWTPSTGTDNYALMDETTFDTTDYVSAATAGNKDYYNCADLGFNPNSIFVVQVTSIAKKDDATTRTFRNNLKSNSTEANGATRGLATTYTVYSDIFETNPDGSVAWTQATVNAAQVGVEVVS